MSIPTHRMRGVEVGMPMGGLMEAPGINMQVGSESMTVTKVNVTTPSTADASQKRRKQPANFVCPVPGCGSTFTRHFNLKGLFHSVQRIIMVGSADLFDRSLAVACGRETVPVQVAWLRQGLCQAARL